MTKLVCFSDIHEQWEDHVLSPPEGDILIFAGDWSFLGKFLPTNSFNLWLEKYGFGRRRNVVVAGNHEVEFSRDSSRKSWLSAATYLEHELLDIDGLRIFGSPYSKEFGNWVYGVSGDKAERIWNQIPEDIDVLVTHGPPFGILDQNEQGEHCGCPYLLERVKKIKPKVHIFGHIHESFGQVKKHGIKFANVSICNLRYYPVNPFTIIYL